jgi:uncharacterized protein YuzE
MNATKPYLEVTYRQRKLLAAYLYLDRRPGDKGDRTTRHGELLVDYAGDGRAIGIEFTHPGSVVLSDVNRVLLDANQGALTPSDLVPLTAA